MNKLNRGYIMAEFQEDMLFKNVSDEDANILLI